MVYNQQFMLLQWGGSFRATTWDSLVHEEFSGSLKFAGPGLDAADNNQTLVALTLALGRYWVSTAAAIPASCFLEYVKWNRITVDGHYAKDQTQVAYPTHGYEGVGARTYPHQVAWATTWQTDAVRGKACRGRTFWPTGIPIVGDTGKVDPTFCQRKAQADINLIAALNQAARTGNVEAAPNPEPAWAAQLGFASGTVRDGSGVTASVMSKIGAGTTRLIRSAGVGDRLDIQRRRGQQPDVRTTVAASAS